MDHPIASICAGTRNELVSMSWAEYHEFPALNGTAIVAGRRSMLHLRNAWEHGTGDSDAKQLGRLLHCLLFDPRELKNRYRSWPGRRAGNEYKAFLAEAEADGIEVVKESMITTALEAAQSFLSNDRVQSLIAAGQVEQALLAVEEGLQCKGRLDWVSTAEHSIVDLKTTAEIEPELFGSRFFRYGYDIKLGLYQRWLNRVTNDHWPVEAIVLETTPPDYDIAVMPIPIAVLDNGVDKALRIIKRVRHCLNEDHWPGLAQDDFMPLIVPYHEMQDAARRDRMAAEYQTLADRREPF